MALWIIQGLLAVAFIGAGMMKLVTPKEKLVQKMPWAKDVAPASIKLLGLAEILGAVGLVVPWWTGIMPILTPIAAAALLVIMIGATATHARLKETMVPPLVLGLLSGLVAVGRFLPFFNR